jgi:hypothetical protein
LIEEIMHGGIDPIGNSCNSIRKIRRGEIVSEIVHESLLDLLIVSYSVPLLVMNKINSILSFSLGSLLVVQYCLSKISI